MALKGAIERMWSQTLLSSEQLRDIDSDTFGCSPNDVSK